MNRAIEEIGTRLLIAQEEISKSLQVKCNDLTLYEANQIAIAVISCAHKLEKTQRYLDTLQSAYVGVR